MLKGITRTLLIEIFRVDRDLHANENPIRDKDIPKEKAGVQQKEVLHMLFITEKKQ